MGRLEGTIENKQLRVQQPWVQILATSQPLGTCRLALCLLGPRSHVCTMQVIIGMQRGVL